MHCITLCSQTYLRMLSQLVSLADDEFLLGFAQSVHEHRHFPNSDAKRVVVSTLLEAAISKAVFHPPPTYPPRPPRSVAGDPSAVAKCYVRIAYKLRCEEMVKSVINRVMDTSSLTSNATLACAQRVLLPLTAFLMRRARSNPQAQFPAWSEFRRLQQTAVGQYLT